MPDPRLEPFIDYIGLIQSKMKLRDWKITLMDNAPENSSLAADMECIYGRQVGNIRLSSSTLSASEKNQRNTIVHELVHCHFAAMHQFLSDTLSDSELIAYKIFFEYAIDAMAFVISQFMPLPSEVENESAVQDTGNQELFTSLDVGGSS